MGFMNDYPTGAGAVYGMAMGFFGVCGVGISAILQSCDHPWHRALILGAAGVLFGFVVVFLSIFFSGGAKKKTASPTGELSVTEEADDEAV